MKKRRDDLFKKMEELERNLRNRSMNTEKALKSLRDFLGEALEAQTSLASKLVEELSIQNIEMIPRFEPELTKGIPSKNLEQTEALLGKFFEGDIPTTVSERILELKRYNELLQTLAKTIDDIESDLRSDSKQGSMVRSSQDEPSEMTENESSKHPGRKKEEASDREGMTSGRGKDTQGKGLPHEIKGSKNIPTKDPAIVGSGKRYNVLVRSLPMVEKAGVKPEDLIRSYRNEIEEVLTNDKIPLNYREYIKNYFLSIGVEREKYENE